MFEISFKKFKEDKTARLVYIYAFLVITLFIVSAITPDNILSFLTVIYIVSFSVPIFGILITKQIRSHEQSTEGSNQVLEEQNQFKNDYNFIFPGNRLVGIYYLIPGIATVIAFLSIFCTDFYETYVKTGNFLHDLNESIYTIGGFTIISFLLIKSGLKCLKRREGKEYKSLKEDFLELKTRRYVYRILFLTSLIYVVIVFGLVAGFVSNL